MENLKMFGQEGYRLTEEFFSHEICSKNKNWNSVPQFGAWEHEAGFGTNYSMIFSQARANRKQQKNNLTRHIIGNERELLTKTQREGEYGVIDMQKKKKKMWRCLSCCIRF